MRDFVENLLQGLAIFVAGKLDEIANLINLDPRTLLSANYWDTLIRIMSMALMPLSIALISFFVAAELYDTYCKQNGEIDVRTVTTTFFRFIIPYLISVHSYDLIQILYTTFTSLIQKIASSFSFGAAASGWDYTTFLDDFGRQNILYQLATIGYLTVPVIIMQLLGGVIWIIVYGRLFEIMLYWLVAPLPLATLPSHEYSQIAKGYLKSFAAVMLQGVLMMICMIIYSVMSLSVFSNSSAGFTDITSIVWNQIWPAAILVFALIKCGNLAKRICGTF